MATQPVQSDAMSLPPNHGGGPRERLLSSGTRSISVLLSDGETVVPLPKHVRMAVTMPRLCGDWYAEIEGAQHVSAVGETQDAAFLAAVAKLAA